MFYLCINFSFATIFLLSKERAQMSESVLISSFVISEIFALLFNQLPVEPKFTILSETRIPVFGETMRVIHFITSFTH